MGLLSSSLSLPSFAKSERLEYPSEFPDDRRPCLPPSPPPPRRSSSSTNFANRILCSITMIVVVAAAAAAAVVAVVVVEVAVEKPQLPLGKPLRFYL